MAKKSASESRSLASELKNPNKTFRGAPFWAWNAKLEPAELRRQIRIMKGMGLGGFFMHSRVGLNTEYLGKDWFKCVKACTDEAKKLGMDAWLYDEDRWPSGAAGGKVTKNFPEYRNRFLDCRTCETEADSAEKEGRRDLAWFVVSGKTEKEIASYRRVDGPCAACGEGEVVIGIAEQVAHLDPWYNGGAYLDTLSTEAVAKFIEVTHEKYFAESGAEFGGVVPGIFTDEPNFSTPTPWTGTLPETFTRLHGYDLLDRLPELFFKVGGEAFSKVRFDYKETVTGLFVNAFGKLIGDWCAQHGLEYTGHLLEEDTLDHQANVIGEAMRFYEHMQAPGIDLLTEHWQVYRTAKQCTSMAHQFGRKRRLSETYGCTGWDFPLEGHKALGDWQMALGINLRCQHLAWYSMEAAAKRDYPASIFRQSPWLGVYAASEEYFARIGEMLFAGEEVRDLLVIHPIESAWGVKIGRDGSAVRPLDASFVALGSHLLGANIDFDYGSEEVMSKHCRVKGKKLFVAKAGYKAVVVPEMLTIRASTLKILADFAAAGGKVFYAGNPPPRVDGSVSTAAKRAFKAFLPCAASAMAEAVSPLARRLSLTQGGVETEATLHLLSENKERLALFICNTSGTMPTVEDEMNYAFVRDRVLEYPGAVLKLKSSKRGDVFEVDTMTGAIHKVAYEHVKGEYIIPCPLGRLESRLFVITEEKLGRTLAVRKGAGTFATAVPLQSEKLKFSLSESNAMVLDHAVCTVDGVKASDEKFILDIDKDLRKALGANPRSGHMVQPWVSGLQKPERELEISLAYTFDCKKIPADGVVLALERPELYTIVLNGKTLKQVDKGFWMDPVIRRLALPRLRKGENELVLTGRYHQFLPGLEAIYLMGAFGVENERTLVLMPETLDIGDWVPQGLENYSGNLTYQFNLGKRPETKQRIFLRIPEWRGVALGVVINGGEEKVLPWPPYELDVTELLGDGRNTAKVTVYGHRRNVCGPFYLNDTKWPNWTGPDQMSAHETRTRGLVPCGLLKPVELAY